MKAKNIDKHIRAKVDDWLSSIEDKALVNLLRPNIIVTGGSIVSLLTDEPVHDYDIYFQTKEAAFAAACHYVQQFVKGLKEHDARKVIYIADQNKRKLFDPYSGKVEPLNDVTRLMIVVKSAGVERESGAENYQYFETMPDQLGESYVENVFATTENAGALIDQADIEETYEELQEEALAAKGKYRPVFLTTNAITLSNKVQLVIRFFGSPSEIHENYDYVHCTNYWTNVSLVLKQEALEAILAKELRYIGSLYPICSIIRMRKFLKRGWYINAGQILKMAYQISKLDLDNISVLEDQLIGVDTAYFVQLIARLKNRTQGNIDQAYLIKIIEELF